MKVEILFPEICNLYGDTANGMYLKKCFPTSTVETSIHEEPKFIKGDIDIVYIGTSSEKYQELIIERLLPYKEKIKEYIEKEKIIIATGNAMEIFEEYIMDEVTNKKIECLNIFKGYAIRNINKRHNSLFLGDYEGIKLVGHKSQFTFSYNIENRFITKERGIGNNKDDSFEGINYKNFYGTYLLGPFLIFNPNFTKKILGIETLPEEEAIYDSYNYRLDEFQNPKTEFVSKH